MIEDFFLWTGRQLYYFFLAVFYLFAYIVVLYASTTVVALAVFNVRKSFLSPTKKETDNGGF